MINFNKINFIKELSTGRSLNKVYLGELDNTYLIIKYFHSLKSLKNEDIFYDSILESPQLKNYAPCRIVDIESTPLEVRLYEYIEVPSGNNAQQDVIPRIYDFIVLCQRTLKYPITEGIFKEYKDIYAQIFPQDNQIIEDILRANCSHIFLSHHDLQVRNVIRTNDGIKIIDPEHSRLDLQYVDLVKLSFFDYNSRNSNLRFYFLFNYVEHYYLSIDCLAITIQVIAYKVREYIKAFPNGSREEQWILEQISLYLSNNFKELSNYLIGLKNTCREIS